MTCKTEKRHSPKATPFPESILILSYECRPKGIFFIILWILRIVHRIAPLQPDVLRMWPNNGFHYHCQRRNINSQQSGVFFCIVGFVSPPPHLVFGGGGARFLGGVVVRGFFSFSPFGVPPHIVFDIFSCGIHFPPFPFFQTF